MVPKSRISPSKLRSNAMAELHKGQKVIATGRPPTTSLTISCHIRICKGIGPRVAGVLEDDHGLIVSEPLAGLLERGELGRIDGRDAVASRPAGPYLGVGHGVEREVRQPSPCADARHAQRRLVVGVTLQPRRRGRQGGCRRGGGRRRGARRRSRGYGRGGGRQGGRRAVRRRGERGRRGGRDVRGCGSRGVLDRIRGRGRGIGWHRRGHGRKCPAVGGQNGRWGEPRRRRTHPRPRPRLGPPPRGATALPATAGSRKQAGMTYRRDGHSQNRRRREPSRRCHRPPPAAP